MSFAHKRNSMHYACVRRRQPLVKPVFKRSPDGSGGGSFGLHAVRPIQAGEIVQRNEQKPHNLVSLQWAHKAWLVGSRDRSWFDAYAYPVSPEVYVTWSDDPREWLPINHACDPNTWLDGLNLVAKR